MREKLLKNKHSKLYCLSLLITTALTGCVFNQSTITKDRTQAQNQTSTNQTNKQQALVLDSNEHRTKHINSVELIEEPTPVAVAPKEKDLWNYIAQRQDLTQIQHSRIQAFEKYFLKHSRMLKSKTAKAAPYLYYIIQELEKRNMPLELAFTPMVESNFDPLAHSVMQAAGLWQFMPTTAKGFGLDINEWYDGRRDIIASTEAALTYYQYLNKMFKGDWLLTVAAYNVGQGNILKAIKKNRKNNKPTDYWSLQLPKETMRHVPKWIALSNLLINNKSYGLQVTPIANNPMFAAVNVEAPANLAQLAKITKIDKNKFYRLNPAYNKLYVPAERKSADILVPIESLNEFEFALQNSPTEIFKVSMSYQVQRGDNLSTIARKHNTNINSVKQLNKLKSDNLQIGQVLKMPGSVEIDQEEEAFFSKLKTNKKRRRYQTYKVRAGDSLWKIAKKFKVSTQKLAKWNSLSAKNILRIGQSLKVWPKG